MKQPELKNESQPGGETQAGDKAAPAPARKRVNPGRRLRAIESAREDTRLPFWMRLIPRREKIGPAYWNVAGTFSLLVNIIMLAAIILLSRETMFLKRLLVQDVLGGLYYNFMLMDQAHITANVPVNLSVPLDLQIPISLQTNVRITADTPVDNASVKISAGIITINGPADIVLPAGTILPIQLDMTVPYQKTIDISTSVSVDIPLAGTQLHDPFVGLQEVVSPYFWYFSKGAFETDDIPICKTFHALCNWWFH